LSKKTDEQNQAYENRDYRKLHELVNENFDLRSKILNISKENREMVEIARKCGASAKFSGSGGAIVGTYEDDDMLRRLMIRLKRVNARVIKPYIL